MSTSRPHSKTIARAHTAAHLLAWTTLCGAATASIGDEVKPTPIPPHMQDVKTPAPPMPSKNDAREVRSSARPAAPLPDGPKVRPAGRGYLAGLDRRVQYDTAADGTVWAAADAYKASFDRRGATYVPFFGSRAPHNFPVHLSLRSIRAGGATLAFDADAAPQRDGDRIVFHRGPVDEVYDLAIGSIEQSFVLAQRPGAGELVPGDLVIELALDTELARSADEHGLVLTPTEGSLGSVRYSNAVAVDAVGRRDAASTEWSADGIAIRVPAERVADAVFPLVVDPMLSTFPVDDSVEDNTNPDVAYAPFDILFAVYERVFSSTDHDVYCIDFQGGGQGAYIDVSTSYWANPKIASKRLSSQFLCVAEVGDPTGGARTIWGRTRDSQGSYTIGPKFQISAGDIGDEHNPDVGGDPSLAAPTYYCVVWQRDYTSSDHDVLARMVTESSNTFGSVIYLSNSANTLDNLPVISKGDGLPPASTQDWNVVFNRTIDFGDVDVYAAQVHWDGSITTPPFAVATTSALETAASVSTLTTASPRRYMIAYSHGALLGDFDIYGKLMQGSTVIDTVDLSSLSGAPTSEQQVTPAIDCDGSSFVLVNAESYNGTSDYDIYASTFVGIGNQITLSEGHVNLAFSTAVENNPDVACLGSAGDVGQFNPRAAVIWQQTTSSTNHDIEGAYYEAGHFTEFCSPGSNGVIACPCGNAPASSNRGCNNSAGTGGARITATGDVNPDSVVLHASGMLPSALCVFAQGDSLITGGVTFGDGVRCVGGHLLRLATKSASSGSSSYPIGADPHITTRSAALGFPIAIGDRRSYYVYYRDPAAFACPLPATFNSSDAVQVQW